MRRLEELDLELLEDEALGALRTFDGDRDGEGRDGVETRDDLRLEGLETEREELRLEGRETDRDDLRLEGLETEGDGRL